MLDISEDVMISRKTSPVKDFQQIMQQRRSSNSKSQCFVHCKLHKTIIMFPKTFKY